MPVLYTWDKSLSVGNAELDRQHQHLFELVGAIPEHPDTREIRRAAVAVFAAAQEHFTLEETRLREIGYPHLDEHHRLHEAFMTRMSEIAANPCTGTGAFFSLRQLLYDWFLGHILTHDKSYARFAPGPFRPANRMRTRNPEPARGAAESDVLPLNDEELGNF